MTGSTRQLEPPRSDRVDHPSRVLLVPLRPLARWIVRRRFDVRLVHPERVPSTGPVILAANHVGVVDGPILTVFAPRPVHVLTKVEMFRGGMGWCLRASGQIPLDRFQTDPAAVKQSIGVLRAGGAVGVFPEGARGAGELERFHRGAAYLAMVTGAPIVPVIMIGTREAGGHTDSMPTLGSRIDLVFGRAFELTATRWPRTRSAVAGASQRLLQWMLGDLEAALVETGRSLPGPLPAGEREPDPGGGVTEKSA